MDKIVIANTITVAAGASNPYDVYRVTGGKSLKIKRVTIIFPKGTEGMLNVAIKNGPWNVYPDQGYFNGDDTQITVETEKVWGSGEKVTIWAQNLDSTESHTFSYVIEGVIE